MGWSYRLFLLDPDDVLFRLPSTTFDRMLRDPKSHCFPGFAGARVRMADVVVERVDREPIRVARTSFGFLTFDDEGYFEPGAFKRQQWARAELALAPLGTESKNDAVVVEAATRFVAQGGCWVPSRALARLIEKVALGQVKCGRL